MDVLALPDSNESDIFIIAVVAPVLTVPALIVAGLVFGSYNTGSFYREAPF
jgi:hypothetical protein